MFKIYQKFLLLEFLSKFIKITLIFFSLIVILSILEEVSFFKDNDKNFFYPIFLTFLSAPSALIELFPFIVLLSTQFLIFSLFKNTELNLLKRNGMSNFKIIKLLFLFSFLIGLFTILIFYNFSSNMKFHYSNIKNNLSTDNKYLAMVTENGIWIKDEINNNSLIIKAGQFQKNFLSNVIINQFNLDFNLIRTIQSDKIDISNKKWILYNPIITANNIVDKNNEIMTLQSNFDNEKIINLFSDISTYDLIDLFSLKEDFEKIGYSSDEIKSHLLRLSVTPIFYAILSVLSATIMFSFNFNSSLILNILIGISMSVSIYYINYIFVSLGNNGKLPVTISIFFPLLVISLVTIIGLVNINEK
jgi:lipopolysaccharide export system permease protein